MPYLESLLGGFIENGQLLLKVVRSPIPGGAVGPFATRESRIIVVDVILGRRMNQISAPDEEPTVLNRLEGRSIKG